MDNFGYQEAKDTLQQMIAEFETGDPEKYEWYEELMPEFEEEWEGDFRGREHILALEAIKHEDLHPLMVKLLKLITAKNYEIDAIWENEEEQAGGHIGRELSLLDPKYIPLYADYLYTNDMCHSVFQDEDTAAILDKYGAGHEVLPLVVSWALNAGQHHHEIIEDVCGTLAEYFEEDHELTDLFLKQIYDYYAENKKSNFIVEVNASKIQTLFEYVFPEHDNEALAQKCYDMCKDGTQPTVLNMEMHD